MAQHSYTAVAQREPAAAGFRDLEAGGDDSCLQCRICLGSDDGDDLIAPCLCRGTARYVHRACLDEWRAQERVRLAFTHCPTCKFEYRTIVHPREPRSARFAFRCYVLRDSCALFVLLQLVLSTVGALLQACDSSRRLAALYPKAWRAEPTAAAFGPYYVSAVVVCLAALGIVGIVLRATNRLPQPRHAPQADRCCGVSCDACCVSCGYHGDVCCYSCFSVCGEGGACAECGLLDACSSGCAGSAEAATLLLPLVAVVVLVFALVGLVVGVVFGTLAVQRIVQRHVHLLQMRTETQRVVVVDLAAEPCL